MIKVAVVIPCFRVRAQILSVLVSIGPEVEKIYLVDDCCPEDSVQIVREQCHDPRLVLLKNEFNQGVGGAVMRGYQAALADGHDVVVKLDGDGQMDAKRIPGLIAPIVAGRADYTKGNRFYNLSNLIGMPFLRLIGNTVLSFLTKLSSGYWNLFDPTNGFTAIHRTALSQLPLERISRGYFFESDMLYQLNIMRAVVLDVPHPAHYGSEQSSLKICHVLPEFLMKHTRNLLKRIFYNYYLRNLTIASFELLLSILFFAAGLSFGLYHWYMSINTGVVASSGTVMIAAIMVLMAMQMLLAFLSYDLANVPKRVLQREWAGDSKVLK